MRISDWSSDVCSSDLFCRLRRRRGGRGGSRCRGADAFGQQRFLRDDRQHEGRGERASRQAERQREQFPLHRGTPAAILSVTSTSIIFGSVGPPRNNSNRAKATSSSASTTSQIGRAHV